MWSAENVVVISDLHIAAERGRGLFQADEQLASFLRWMHKELCHCHLFLNGDIFDFLAGKKEEKLDLADAEAQSALIARNHKEVFQALSLIVNSKEHEVTILGGNHDPELALPSVQAQLEQQLAISCPHSHLRWLTNGEGAFFEVGAAKILIEHGDQYDPWNWIDHEGLRRTVSLASRNVSYDGVYRSPPGSRLVINRFNVLRDKFNWIETLQPLSPSLLPLALEVVLPSLARNERDQVLGAVRELKNFAERSATDKALTLGKSRSRFWADDDEERQILSEWLARYQKEEDTWGVTGDFKAALARAIARLRTLSSTAILKRMARRNSFFQIEAQDEQHSRVIELMAYGADLVVHGHTHASKAYAVGDGLYLNTGTWGRLTKLPEVEATEEDWTSFIETLRTNRASCFNRPTFVRIHKQGDSTTASLWDWAPSGGKIQSEWLFENKRWRKVTLNSEH